MNNNIARRRQEAAQQIQRDEAYQGAAYSDAEEVSPGIGVSCKGEEGQQRDRSDQRCESGPQPQRALAIELIGPGARGSDA